MTAVHAGGIPAGELAKPLQQVSASRREERVISFSVNDLVAQGSSGVTAQKQAQRQNILSNLVTTGL